MAERDRELVSAINELDDGSFLSLCFGPSVSIRTWLLNNAERFQIRPSLLFTVFLGFTKDPYPYVRKAALDGLVGLGNNVFEDGGMIEGCYYRAIELLNDTEDCVRSAAVRVVITWGLMLAAHSPERKRYLSDEIFINLCSMTRDMSMKVRVNAFDAINKLEIVSEDILLQSVSKRVLGIFKGKKPLVQCSTEQLEMLALDVAGAFVHGVEDEFYQVRKSACNALYNLAILSTKFAGEALNLLMDILNDDSVPVRLQALETLHHMAMSKCLKLQEAHMHMFLGALSDSNGLVRYALRKLLKLAKLPDLETFQLSFNGLLESLESYPQDESDVLSVLFHMGQNHVDMAASIIHGVFKQIDPTSEGELGFDSVRVTAYIVLAISAPVLDDHTLRIPSRLFSYAVTLLGKISHALGDIMDQSTFFAYLLQNSKNTGSSDLVLNPEGSPCSTTPGGSINDILVSLRPPIMINEQRHEHDDTLESIKTVLSKVQDIWPLIQSGFLHQVLRTLRFCKEALGIFMHRSNTSSGALAFTLQYLKIIKLVAKVWNLMSTKLICARKIGEWELLLGKLERGLKELRSRFTGFSKEEELHILELMLVTYTLRLLYNGEVWCHLMTLRKLSIIASDIEHLLKEGCFEPSTFVFEAQKALSSIGTLTPKASYNLFDYRKLLQSFTLNHLKFSGKLKHIKAELVILDNDYEKPVHFVPGLPVGIPCQIILHNVLSERKLWVRITVDGMTSQFVFLDFLLFGGCDEVREFTYVVPFYRTPKASSFIARICIGLECWCENAEVRKRRGRGGPKHDLAYICKEKEVYLSTINKGLL